MPIIFFGKSFGNIISGTTYYVKTIESSTQITISSMIGGSVFTLVDGTGLMTAIIGGEVMSKAELKVVVVKKQGRLWNDLGQRLAKSTNTVANFLKDTPSVWPNKYQDKY